MHVRLDRCSSVATVVRAAHSDSWGNVDPYVCPFGGTAHPRRGSGRINPAGPQRLLEISDQPPQLNLLHDHTATQLILAESTDSASVSSVDRSKRLDVRY